MVISVLSWFQTIFYTCALWAEQILNAVDGAGVVLAAFCVVLVIGLLFIPMRGRNLVTSFDSLKDFAAGSTHKKSKSSSYIHRS